MKIIFLIVAVILLFYFLKSNNTHTQSNMPTESHNNSENRQQGINGEWPVIYKTSVHAEVHTIKLFLESEGVEVILEEVTPGTWGDGVASKHSLRAHPEDVREAEKLLRKWEKDIRTE